MDQQDHIEKLQKQINLILKTNSSLKHKKKTKEDIQKNIFVTTINLLEHIIHRGVMLELDYGFNTAKYDESFYRIIDSLFHLHFSVESTELILFYLYDRINPDGSINPILDINGKDIILHDVDDLWFLVDKIESELKK